MSTKLAALFRRLPRRSHNSDRSSAVDTVDGAASPFLGTNALDALRVVSIDQPSNQISTQEG